MNERVKEVRKALNLTMEKFGERLGVKKNSISQIENASRNLTRQMLLAICREFNVNEEWLKNGTGDMFIAPYKGCLNINSNNYHLDYIDEIIIFTYITLPLDKREAVKAFICNLVNNFKEDNNNKF